MRLARGTRFGTIAVMAIATLPVATHSLTEGARPQPTSTMLVFLRPSFAPTPRLARIAQRVAGADVASLARNAGAKVLAMTTVPATMTLQLTTAQSAAMSRSPLVAAVLPNATIPGPGNPMLGAGLTRPARAGAKPPARTVSCGTARDPQLNPEGLSNINDTSQSSTHGYIGRGVKVAFLADGIFVGNPDLRRDPLYASSLSPARSRVIARYMDFSGDGTGSSTGGGEAFLDASSIAAQGNAVYDLGRYVDHSHPLPAGCDARIVGSAPGATVYALKIFASNNATTGSGFVQAINYAVANGVKVINESFGANPFPDTAGDIIRAADDAAVAAGVTVVVSTGDAGITSTIGSPASDPNVLAVGASTTFRAYQQMTFGGINMPGESGRYRDNNISSLSSAGFAQSGRTVDLVAPGDLNWTLCTKSSQYADCSGASLQLSGGTSEAAPLTAGAAADVIQAYRTSHHGAYPAPALVKQILMSTATDIAAPANQQGAGLLNVGRAVELALTIPGSTHAPVPSWGNLLVSTSQLNVAGLPSSHLSSPVSLTNASSIASHVTVTTRGLVAVHVAAGHVTLNPRASSRQPRLTIWSGAPEVYQKVHLRVGRAIDRIVLQVGYRFSNQTSVVHVALFAPNGALAGYSNPQGQGDYAEIEVAKPEPGVWTAALFTLWDGYSRGGTGTTGPEPFSFTELRYRALGAVTPSSFTLAPGASRTVQYAVTLPSTSGDAAASIVLHATRATSTIPVTLRTLIPIGTAGGSFSGRLTGGNGRGGAPGQTNTYAFTVPAGKHDLDVGIRLASNPPIGAHPGDQLVAMLVDPSGQVVAYDTNYTVNSVGPIVTRFCNLYAANPAPGSWTLLLDWAQPTSGARTSIPFAGSVEFNQVLVSSSLPNAASTVVPLAGSQFSLTVHDTGVAPLIVSPDARLTTTMALSLVDSLNPATQDMPNASNAYYVPTETSSATFSVASSVHVTFDASFQPGDPDLSPLVAEPFVASTVTPTSASLTFTPPGGLSSGLWNLVQSPIGPYPSGGTPHVAETTSATATTRAFDPAVSSPVPDTVQAMASGSTIAPDIIAPGSTDTIPITITPTASVGTVVTGTLFVTGVTPGSQYVGTVALTSFFTSDLAAIPYQYKVGP